MATKTPSKAAATVATSIVDINRPNVERGATMLKWTDRQAYFVEWVSEDGKECHITRAKQTADEAGTISFQRAPEAVRAHLKYRYGAWWAVTESTAADGTTVTDYERLPGTMYFGGMEEHIDYSRF